MSAPALKTSIGVQELADRSGVAPSAIRFYDRNGLIHAERTSGNQRRFHETTACVIKVIRVAQRVGLSVAEIRELTDQLPPPERIGMDDWFRFRAALEEEVRRRITELNEALDDLTGDTALCKIPSA